MDKYISLITQEFLKADAEHRNAIAEGDTSREAAAAFHLNALSTAINGSFYKKDFIAELRKAGFNW